MRGPPSSCRRCQTGRMEGACAAASAGTASLKYSAHINSLAAEGAFHFVSEMLLLHTQESHKGTLAGQDQINTCTERNIYPVNDI